MDKVVIISGGSDGLGYETAKILAPGNKVVVLSPRGCLSAFKSPDPRSVEPIFDRLREASFKTNVSERARQINAQAMKDLSASLFV